MDANLRAEGASLSAENAVDGAVVGIEGCLAWAAHDADDWDEVEMST